MDTPPQQRSLNTETNVPLVVDLDRTLILTDSLHEGLAKLFFSNPLGALFALPVLLKSRAAFKAYVAEKNIVDAASFPYRNSLIDLIKVEKSRGRSIHLVTAADQRTADAIAAHLGLFDSATGSNGRLNLKGKQKLAWLRERFKDNFIYAGDQAADLPLFAAACGAILCDVNPRVAKAARQRATILAELRENRPRLKTWIRAFRVHQWSKNVLVFIPLLVGHAYNSYANILTSFAAFVLVCLLASATYMFNDIADVEADRRHHTKQRRPFASGSLSIAAGLILAPLLVAVSVFGGYLLAPDFAWTLLIYLFLTLLYSFGLKQIPLLDVFVIGILFMLRIVMGTMALSLNFSPWLLSFSWAFFLSLALAKRHVEVSSAAHLNVEDVVGRGYRGDDWPLTLTFGVGAGLISIVIMLLYLTNDAMPSGFYDNPKWLYLIPALIMMWLMRIWLLSNRMQLDDDPVVFALRDPASLTFGVAALVVFFLAL